MPIAMTQFPQLFQVSSDTPTRLATLKRLGDLSYDTWPVEYEDFMRTTDIDQESESDFEVGGFGLPVQVTVQGGGLNLDTQGNWPPQTYVPQPFNLGFDIDYRLQMNDKWGLAGQRSKWLARSFRRLPEVLAARMLNEGFATPTQEALGVMGRRTPDGVSLFNSAHPMPFGGLTQSNTNDDGGADLTHASVQAIQINMATRTDDRGGPIRLDMKLLITPPQLYHRGLEINKSSFRTDADRRIMNILSTAMPFEVRQNHYLTDPSAYFAFAEKERTGLRFLWRERPNLHIWTDPNTRAIVYGIWCQLDFGWSWWYGSFGDPGAAG